MTINQLADDLHQQAVSKGWHLPGESEDAFIERACNNLHNEISELHESWRNNRLRDLCDKSEKMAALGLPPLTCLEEEFADILIRAMDNCRRLGVDVERAIIIKHKFNASREFRHGGKRS